MWWVKFFQLIAMLSFGFQYGILFSKFSKGAWQTSDTVLLGAVTFSAIGITIAALAGTRA